MEFNKLDETVFTTKTLGIIVELTKTWNYRPPSVTYAFPRITELTIGEVLTHWANYRADICTCGENSKWYNTINELITRFGIESFDGMNMEHVMKSGQRLTSLLSSLGFFFGSSSFNAGRYGPSKWQNPKN